MQSGRGIGCAPAEGPLARGCSKDKAGTKPFNIVAVYSYQLADGTEHFQVCRMQPKDFRQRHRENGASGNGAAHLRTAISRIGSPS